MKQHISRRGFLAASAAAAAAGMTTRTARAAAAPPVCVFSKHLQFLDYKELAKTCKDAGLDGVDLTVRNGGHVLPDNVKRDLPAAVDAIRAEGLEVPMITTRLSSGADPDAEPILSTASELGIKYFRIGGQKYDEAGPIRPQLEKFAVELRSLAEVAEKHDMHAGYHNHSGWQRVGAPVWDLYTLFGMVGSPNIGANFDIGHATIEGAYGDWHITARMMAPYVKMMAVKDFVWEDRREGEPDWVPLGKGVVDITGMLRIMRKADFAGPISIHIEYDVRDGDAMIEQVVESNQVLRGEMRRAGY